MEGGHAACSVPGCHSYAKRETDLSFHSFPSDQMRRKQWTVAIHREEGPLFKVKKGSTFVCSRHFVPEDYNWTAVRCRLKSTATPSIFDNCKGWEKINERKFRYTPRKPPTKRQRIDSDKTPATTGSSEEKSTQTEDLEYGRQMPDIQQLLNLPESKDKEIKEKREENFKTEAKTRN